jgi:CubicO group peptidase (beta-lactamase class C family)
MLNLCRVPHATVVLAVLCMSRIAAGQSGKPMATDNPLATSVDSAVQAAATVYMAYPGSVGLSVGLSRGGRATVYHYGESIKGNGQLPRSDQFYNLGSVAKVFVGTMLAEAVVEKKAKLTDDIRLYLPGRYPNLEYQGHPVRLVDLANHTSGMPRSPREVPEAMSDSISRLPLTTQVRLLRLYTQDSLLQDMHHFRIDTIPGTKYRYNGNAMMVLVVLLERIYHQPFEQLATHYLQTHLHLFDTRTAIPAGQMSRFAQGYGDSGRAIQWFDASDHSQRYATTLIFNSGGPSMNSTMTDMLKFTEANLVERDPAIRLTHQLTWRDSTGFAVGLNWMSNLYNGERYFYHSGHTAIGFNTLCTLYPREHLGIVIFVNDNVDQDRVSEVERTVRAALH